MTAISGQQQHIYQFDNFRLDTAERQLLRDGQAVQLPAKAFDLLVVLLENRGQLVGKEELYRRVWADQIVEESNLTVQMSAIRKALGERKQNPRYIVTVAGHGYRFIGAVATNVADREVVIETETLSRIVIEKEEIADQFAGNLDALLLLADRHQASIANAGAPIATQIESQTRSPKEALVDGGKSAVAAVATVEALPATAVKDFRRHRRIWFLSGGLLLALVIASILFFWPRALQRKHPAPPTTIPFAEVKVKQLTTKGKVRWAALSPDHKFYAYTLSERGEYKESLWLGQTDGNNDIRLRPPADVTYYGLAFSPDNRTLYFTLEGKEPSQNGLFKLPVLGGVAEKLSDQISDYFALSPDGKQIAFSRTDKATNASSLVIADSDCRAMRELLTRPADKAFSRRLAWSPDGSLIAVAAVSDSFKERREIFTVRIADGQIEQLTALEWIMISNLVWLRDGRGLIVVATDKNETLRHLWRVDYPGGNAHRLSRDTDSYGSALSMAADGDSLTAVQIRRESNIWVAPAANMAQARQISFSSINGVYGWSGFDWTPNNRIVFAAGIDRAIAIYSMEADGSDIKPITSAGFFDRRPKVTADGRFIVFQSNRNGSNEIWRVGVDGSDLRQLTTGGGNSAPHPTPDSRWIVYTATRDGKSFVFRVPIDGGEPVRVTDQEATYPRVSPDGKLIACGYKADATSPEQLALMKFEDGTLVKLFEVARSARFADGIRWTPNGAAVCYRDLANGIWRQEIKGGAPQKLSGLPEEAGFAYDWSRDGKRFAFTRGRNISDTVLISNFQ